MARKPVVDMSAWPSLSLEGNLIAPAMVASVDRREASEQTEADYRIRKGLTIREEISTAFRVGQSHFDTFARIANPSADATRRFVKQGQEYMKWGPRQPGTPIIPHVPLRTTHGNSVSVPGRSGPSSEHARIGWVRQRPNLWDFIERARCDQA